MRLSHRKAIVWVDHEKIKSEKGLTVYHTLNLEGNDVWVVERKMGNSFVTVVTTLPMDEAVQTAQSLQ